MRVFTRPNVPIENNPTRGTPPTKGVGLCNSMYILNAKKTAESRASAPPLDMKVIDLILTRLPTISKMPAASISAMTRAPNQRLMSAEMDKEGEPKIALYR